MTDRDGDDQAFVDAISEWPDINDGPTLAGFLLARITEDEAAYRDAGQLLFTEDRCRAECEAKRRIVLRLRAVQASTWDDSNPETIAEDVLRYLAMPYADHPDYQEAWRP